jgi:hypothetical protein
VLRRPVETIAANGLPFMLSGAICFLVGVFFWGGAGLYDAGAVLFVLGTADAVGRRWWIRRRRASRPGDRR